MTFLHTVLMRVGRFSKWVLNADLWHNLALIYLVASTLFVGAAFIPLTAVGETTTQRNFILNQTMIQDLAGSNTETACAFESVLDELFAQIGPQANVYPTENYYYFKFTRAAKSFSGSLRLAVDQRDEGIIQFACFESYRNWLDQDAVKVTTKDLGAAQGVEVKKLDRLKYAVSFNGRSVTFNLNDLDQTAPKTTNSDEKFVGRGFDESGLIFQLIYNMKKKFFFFVLDQENPVAETFVRAGDEMLLGKRTGFVFHRDNDGRQILIAVHADEVHTNSWNDGPFDQLPENFYKEIEFWETVFDANPDLRGKVSQAGVMLDDPETIYAIWAYREYSKQADLAFVTECKAREQEQAALLACLTNQEK